ncbi:MAG TPA: rhodanese-like domain-containing protein [bacterium]|jgi:rhodanese-related sulfurtransferase|nr:rhodanese-like domain-containing protein [bacterium]
MAITKEVVLEKMKDKETVVLDVLPKTDYEMLNIKGSFSLPIVGMRPEDFARVVEQKYGRDRFFITYCSGFPCRHFQEAADALVKQGLKAEGYPGGIQEWAESGLPVEGTQAKA